MIILSHFTKQNNSTQPPNMESEYTTCSMGSFACEAGKPTLAYATAEDLDNCGTGWSCLCCFTTADAAVALDVFGLPVMTKSKSGKQVFGLLVAEVSRSNLAVSILPASRLDD